MEHGISRTRMKMMCIRSVEILSFPALLADPMVRMAMASDGVSEQEMRSLLQHVSEVIAERHLAGPERRFVEPVGHG